MSQSATTSKPRVFIGSSAESLDVADAINVNLDHQAEVTVWKHGFELSSTTIENLVRLAGSVDFAVFVFTPDDLAEIRGNERPIVRDNVLFELGLFAGTLGRERCFMVKPRDEELHFPTDLLGLTPADYEGNRSDGNLEAAINHPCVKIKKEIARISSEPKHAGMTVARPKKAAYSYELGDPEHRLLATVLETYAEMPEGVAVWNAFRELKGFGKGVLGLAAIKLERLGYISKSILMDQDDQRYYSFAVTPDGIDYLLENEESLRKAIENAVGSGAGFDDDDIPF